MRVIACDVGKKGAFALLGVDNPVADKMPLIGTEIDCKAIAQMLAKVKPDIVVIEKVHSMPKQGVASMFKFGTNYGLLRGIVEGMGIPCVLVTPQTWKKVLNGTKKDKEAAIQFVRMKYPTIKLIPTGCRVPHDGIADAVCIGDWYINNHKA